MAPTEVLSALLGFSRLLSFTGVFTGLFLLAFIAWMIWLWHTDPARRRRPSEPRDGDKRDRV